MYVSNVMKIEWLNMAETKMKNSNVSLFLVMSLFIFCFANNASAACMGIIPVFGTGDTKETCKAKKYGDAEEEKPEEKPEVKTENNTNVIIGDQSNKKQPDSYNALIPTIHQIRIELAPYIVPGAYQFDMGMPERFMPNGVAYEYYLNTNLAFGFLYQEISKTGSRGFDPVDYKDASGDTHTIAFPGAIDRLQYRLYIPYVSFNAKMAPTWCLGGRIGLGRVEVTAEYNGTDISGSKKFIDNTSLLVDLFFEKWYSGAKIGGALRYIESKTDTSNYLEYMNMGSAQIVLYVQFTLKTFGVL